MPSAEATTSTSSTMSPPTDDGTARAPRKARPGDNQEPAAPGDMRSLTLPNQSRSSPITRRPSAAQPSGSANGTPVRSLQLKGIDQLKQQQDSLGLSPRTASMTDSDTPSLPGSPMTSSNSLLNRRPSLFQVITLRAFFFSRDFVFALLFYNKKNAGSCVVCIRCEG